MGDNRTIDSSRLALGDVVEITTQLDFGPKVRRLKYFVPPFHYSHTRPDDTYIGAGSVWVGQQQVTLYKTGEKVVYGSS